MGRQPDAGSPWSGQPTSLIQALDRPVGADRDPVPHRRTRSGRFRDAGLRTLAEAAVPASSRHAEPVVDTAVIDGQPTAVTRAEALRAAMIVLGSRKLSDRTAMPRRSGDENRGDQGWR